MCNEEGEGEGFEEGGEGEGVSLGFDGLVVQEVFPAGWERRGEDDFGVGPGFEAGGWAEGLFAHERSDEARGDRENGLVLEGAGEGDDAGVVEAVGFEG